MRAFNILIDLASRIARKSAEMPFLSKCLNVVFLSRLFLRFQLAADGRKATWREVFDGPCWSSSPRRSVLL